MKPSSLLSSFILFVKRDQVGVINILRILFKVLAFTMQNSLVIKDGCLKVVWNVRFVCIESIAAVNLLIVNVRFNFWKYRMHYNVYIGNSSYFFLFFFVIASYSENNRPIFVLLFLFLTLVCILATSFDKFELQCQKRLSQIKVKVPIRFKFKLYVVFLKWSLWKNFLFMRGQDIVNNWDFLSKISRYCHKRLVPKNTRHDQRELFVKMTPRDRLDWLVDSVGMILLCLLTPCLPAMLKLSSARSLQPAAPFTQQFSQSLSSHIFCSCLEILSTTNNLYNFWHGKFQQVSTYAFCSWDDIFTQNWDCSSPNNLCKCTESPSMLSTNTSIVWNLFLSWSNHLVTSFRLEMNVEGFSEHQRRRVIPTDAKGIFSPLVSLKSMWILWKDILSSGLNWRLLNVW